MVTTMASENFIASQVLGELRRISESKTIMESQT